MSTSCENYGIPNGTACACPPGFGGATCSQPACGGNIFQGSGRSLASGSPFANLTSCSCDDGWTGTGCSVCQSAKACQAGFSAALNGTFGVLPGSDPAANETLTCNVAPRVYAAGEMSCQVQVSSQLLIIIGVPRSSGQRFSVIAVGGSLEIVCASVSVNPTRHFVPVAAGIRCVATNTDTLLESYPPSAVPRLINADHPSYTQRLVHSATQHNSVWK